MFVKKTDQILDGQMIDINLENNLVAFASPVDSIKAGLQIIINNSSIIQDDTIKKYGHNPRIIEILKEYPVDTIKYANDLEEKTNFTRDDTINFYDANQVSEFVKFLIQNNMGDENFNKYYPPNNQELLYKFIFEGYTHAINSYGGKLNRLN
jgi:hypothetical protein